MAKKKSVFGEDKKRVVLWSKSSRLEATHLSL